MQSPDENRSRLPLVLGIAVGVALVMTVISVSIYILGGFYKLDLSRPGYEIEREDVVTDQEVRNYDTTSPISPEQATESLDEFDTRLKSLDNYGDFNDDALNDKSILIGQ